MLKFVAITLGIGSAYLTRNSSQVVRALIDTLSWMGV